MEHKMDLRITRKQKIYELPREYFYGKTPDGRELGFTNYYMTIDGKPVIGISGECHFSRVSEGQWEDTVLKMKAGGINVVATYVFWNHHEETEGCFRFDGRRNLRGFVEMCQKHGLYVILRIGPFDHGEVRNGGFPDWLYGKPFDVRSDNEGYLSYVRRLYEKISEQVRGLLFKDGGPVIAAQIENEYMHSAAPWEMTTGISNEWIPAGKEGCDFMKKLKKLAIEAGIDVPFYTCTGWGGAATPAEEMMPLWGGYAFWPWMFYKQDYVHPPTPEYLYRDNHNGAVKKTYNFEPTYDPETRPYACCEMGGGMMNVYNYRFQLPYESVDAMANIKLGSGCNFLGYYMYRGGSNPLSGSGGYLNEGQCPKISYDYQAPIGEFGQLRPSFFRLRVLHTFLKHFGDRLSDLVTVLPEDAAKTDPANQVPLRFALRTDGNRGFIFLNNYQDHAKCIDKVDESISLLLSKEEIKVEPISLKAEENAILPFNMDIEGTRLIFATAQPLSVLRNGEDVTYVFFTPRGMKSRFVFEDGEIWGSNTGERTSFYKNCKNGKVRFVLLTAEESLKYTEIEISGRERAFLSEDPAVYDGRCLKIEYRSKNIKEAAVKKCGINRYLITVPDLDRKAKDALLKIDYLGDIGSLFDTNGTPVNDNFSNAAVWEVGLKEIGGSGRDTYTLYITPQKKNVVVDVSSVMAGRKESGDGFCGELKSVTVEEIYDRIIDLTDKDNVDRILEENELEIII